MKKVCLFALVALFSFSTANAQGNLEASAEVGFVTGDSSDFSSISLGIALSYLFEVSDDFKVGPSVGYTNYFGKDFTSGSITFKTDDFGVIPILGKAQYSVSDEFYLEAGAGYAVFTGDGDGGEATWRVGGTWTPSSIPGWGFGVGYNSITGDGGSIDSFLVGVRRSF